MTRSGSGRPAVYRRCVTAASSIDSGGGARRHEPADGVDELGPAGVVERDVEQQPFAVRGRVEGLVDRAAGLVGQLVEPAEQPDADALAPQLVGLAADRRLEQAEQAVDLVVGARPVLAAEGVQGQDRDAAPDGVPEDARGWPRRRPRGPRARAGPAARAQRRLPSMMIATWRGSSSGGRNAAQRASSARAASIAGVGTTGAVAGSCADGGASVGRASGARATRPRGPPVPSRRRVDRPRRCGGRSSSGARRAGGAPRRRRPCRRALPS